MAAGGTNFAGAGHRFNAVVDPATSEQAPGTHSRYKKVDDDDGGVDFDFGFGFGYGNPWWGWGGPWYGGPYWGPSVQYYYYPQPHRTGELKIETHRKNAEVYIDGAYAGTIKNKDKFALRPGEHELAVRASNGNTFDTEVYVTRGQTLIVRPDFAHAGSAVG